MTGTFHIVLKQEEGFDVHDIREFDLALESKFPIGRASKNQTKGYLLPAKHNVYIDSPVVSREHAILTADAASGKPQVFVTDTKSMHGTYVNGTALVPYQAKQLSNGDKLQFGVNVNRNESYFMAYKYTFNAELADLEPFSRGFTVPEAESEDEELDSVVRSRGSQLNPLVLDESDAESEPEDEDNAAVLEHSENNLDVTMAHIDEEELVNIDISEDEDVADDVDTGIWSDSESDEASTGSAPEYSPESSLMHEAPHLEEVQVQVAVPVAQAEPFQPLSVQWTPVDEQRRATADLFFADFVSAAQPDRPVSQSPHTSPSDEPPAATRESTVAPPLPPRPSQKRQRVLDDAVREEQTWHTETSFAPLVQDNGIFFQYSAPAVEIEPTPASLPAADRMQTPPHTKLIDAAFAPSTHGSDVASPGFVDVQPPTPTSINSRKRSADEAFQENTEGSIEEIALTSELEGRGSAQPVLNVDTHDQSVIPTVEEVNSAAHRPIAQPKSILRRVLRAAKVMVPATALGAVFTVTALTTLPESFFTVP